MYFKTIDLYVGHGSAVYLKDVNLYAVLVCAVAAMVVGFVWYSPMLFARPWMRAMGLDPDDKARVAEMQKGAGPSYGVSFVSALITAFVLGKIIWIANVSSPLLRDEGGSGGMAGFCDHRAVDRGAFRQAAVGAVFDQYWLSAGLLFGDGSDFGGVAVGSALPSRSQDLIAPGPHSFARFALTPKAFRR